MDNKNKKNDMILFNITKINNELDNIDDQLEKNFQKNNNRLKYYNDIINRSMINYQNIIKNLSK